MSIIAAVALQSCNTSFGSTAQRHSYNAMASDLKRLQRGKQIKNSNSGVLVIFDNNGASPIAKQTVRGQTKEAAMFALVRGGSPNPCRSRGPKATIAAFAPPPTVDLPMDFVQCSTLRDQAKLIQTQKRTLEKLVGATASNRASLDRIAKDLAAIANAQDMSWAQVIALLEQMSGARVGAGK